MSIMINIITQLIGGLGLFLYGMRVMSESVEEIAGYRLKKLISKATSSIFRGVLLGGLVTAIIQSSSVTTVMAVGFVNSGLMTLKQAIGIIFGANIGTTITGWILALKITKYGLPLLGLGALTYLFSSKAKRRKQALAFMGLGMIFVGLTFMKSGVKPLKEMDEFIRFFSLFSATNYRGVILSALMGATLTGILQSSSATVGITMALASQGIIDSQTAVALVLGENIGTTITAYLSSLGASLEAKRVAYAHILIKIIGVCVILPLFYPYLHLISKFLKPEDGITKYIALSHTLFNGGLVILFIPFVENFLKLLEKIGTRDLKEKRSGTNECIYKIPSIVLEKSKGEVVQMLSKLEESMDIFYKLVTQKRVESDVQEIFKGEEFQDEKKESVHKDLTSLLNCVSSHMILNESRLLMKIADEIESMGDYGASLAKVYIKLINSKVSIKTEGIYDIEVYHRLLENHLRHLKKVVLEGKYQELEGLRARCNEVSFNLSNIDPLEKKDEYSEHVVMEILAKYRRINRHIIYVIDAMETYNKRSS